MTDRRAMVSFDTEYKGNTNANLSLMLTVGHQTPELDPPEHQCEILCFTLFTPSRCKALNPKPLQPVHSPKPQTLLNPQALDTQVPLNPLNPGRNVVLGGDPLKSSLA